MKKLKVSAICRCWYTSSIEVPDEMTIEEAIEYAKENIDIIPLGDLEYISNSDELDEELCEFEEELT